MIWTRPRLLAGCAVALLFAPGADAQQADAQQPPSQSPRASSGKERPNAPDDLPSLPSIVDIERIRVALERSTGVFEAAVATIEVDGTTFRVSVTQRPFNIWEFWGEPDNAVASYVRPWHFSAWHHEYLRMVTPEYGRRAALYPIGVPVLPLAEMIKEALRNRARHRAKQEVRDALEEFLKENPGAKPAPPPQVPPP